MAAEQNPSPLPCKVWSADRKIRKSVIAASVDELIHKGKAKLGLDEVGMVVLEEDGTEVEDDDYFRSLKPNTIFILLDPREVWKASRANLDGQDEPDFQQNQLDMSLGGNIVSDGPDNEEALDALLMTIVRTIRADRTKIITLSNEEMEVLVNAEQRHLASLLGSTNREAGRIQLNCQRFLDDRAEALDAIALLKTCRNPNKRQKTK